MAYQTIWTPDPMPPQQQGPYSQPNPQFVYVPTPPLPPNAPNPSKKGSKGLSVKRVRAIAEDWPKILEEIEQAKKGKHHGGESKKRQGLNWVELTLFLVFVSPIVAALEVGMAIMVVHLIGK